MSRLFIPEKIYIEKDATDFTFTRALSERVKRECGDHVPTFEIINDKKTLLNQIMRETDPIRSGKNFLFLTVDRGQAFKSFPNSNGLVSCNFYSLHLIEGCDLECSYCILQAYLTNPLLTVCVNTEEILEGLEAFLKENPGQVFRIGTGQLADSLSLDHLTAHSEILVPFFARQKNALLELKTKSVNIARLEKLDSKGRTIVAWSMNTKKIQREEEHKCSSIEERIEAATLCIDWGYSVAFHFDPLIDYEHCEEEYEALVEEIFSEVLPKKVAWVSLGTLRFMPELKSIMEGRFPKSPLPYGEWVRGVDGKLRYFKKRRIELYQTLTRALRRWAPAVPLYFCMETEEVWREVCGENIVPREVMRRLDTVASI